MCVYKSILTSRTQKWVKGVVQVVKGTSMFNSLKSSLRLAAGRTEQAPVLVWCVLTWHLQLKLPTVVLYTRLQWSIADKQGPWYICWTCKRWNQRGPGVSSDSSITMHCSSLHSGLAGKAGHRFTYSYYDCYVTAKRVADRAVLSHAGAHFCKMRKKLHCFTFLEQSLYLSSKIYHAIMFWWWCGAF